MFRGSLQLGAIRGIPIRIHFTWLMKGEPPSPSAEFLIAIVGPLASLVLAGLFWVLWRALETEGPNVTFAAIAFYLVSLNLVVAIFNLLPAFPLDGGRVLRSIIWAVTRNLKQATYLATRIGRGFAYLLITLGAVSLIAGAGFQGVWMAVIVVFLVQGAEASYTQVVLKEALAGIAVRDIMVKDVATVPPTLSVTDLIHHHFLVHGYGGFPVVENGRVLGIVSLSDVKRVAPAAHSRVSVREVMRPLDDRLTIAPEEDVSVALQRMAEEGLGRLIVMERGRMRGLVTKTGLSRVIQMKLALQG